MTELFKDKNKNKDPEKDKEKDEELSFIRIRTKQNEIMIAPGIYKLIRKRIYFNCNSKPEH